MGGFVGLQHRRTVVVEDRFGGPDIQPQPSGAAIVRVR